MRLFLAISPSASARAAMSRFLQRRGAQVWGRSIRPVPAENIHLTLRFLGERSGGDEFVSTLREAVAPAVATTRPMTLAARGIGTFPDRGPVRTVWAGVEGDRGDLVALEAELTRVMARIGIEADPRGFHPHWTLGRARGSGPGPARDLRARLAELGLDEDGEPLRFGDPFAVGRVHLYESLLSPGGARHVERASFPLEGGRGNAAVGDAAEGLG